MKNALLITALVVLPVGLFVGFIMLPRCVRGMARTSTWILRDALVDEIFAGRLPSQHPAVVQLRSQLDFVLRHAEKVSMLDIYMFGRCLRGLDPAVFKAVKANSERRSLDGLSKTERQIFMAYRKAGDALVHAALLLGSWFGIAQFTRFFPAELRRRRHAFNLWRESRAHRFEAELRDAARAVTERAVADTGLGHRIVTFTKYDQALVSETFARRW